MTATPRTIAAATRLLERYADLDARCALLEQDRTNAIAAANQRADVASAPMLAELAKISAALEQWWPSASAEVAGSKKSAQLGGCMIGTKLSRPKLAHGFESDDKALEALLATRFAKHTTRVKYSLDRVSTMKLLAVGGKTGQAIAGLGFRAVPGEDQFFVQRAEQVGSITS